MFDSLFGFGGQRPSVGSDIVGTIVEWDGKKYQAVARVSAFHGAFFALEVGENGKAHYGQPVVLVQHAPTVLKDLDAVETKLRTTYAREWEWHRLEGEDQMAALGKAWSNLTEQEDHLKSCAANRVHTSYNGHSAGTVETDPLFTTLFCPAHKVRIDAWYMTNKAVPNSWPPGKIE